jgi:hypothetical protein
MDFGGQGASERRKERALAMGFSNCGNPAAVVNLLSLDLALVILPANVGVRRQAAWIALNRKGYCPMGDAHGALAKESRRRQLSAVELG